MATYNDLINVTFEDAVTYGTTDTTDILGVIMPYHWGPAGKVNIFNKQEFYDAYPEKLCAHLASNQPLASTYDTYYKVKSFFNNGGSRVAVYRNEDDAYYGNTTLVEGFYAAFKYRGLPPDLQNILANSIVFTINADTGIATVSLYNSASTGENTVLVETFSGQLTNETAVSETGETTYLPKILEQKSQYLKLIDSAPTAIGTSYTPSPEGDTCTLASIFATSATLVPTMFLEHDNDIDAYNSSVAFIPTTTNDNTIVASGTGKFDINVHGGESIKVFGTFHEISCEAGVAGAYSNIARQTHLNQIASAQAYGAYAGTLFSGSTFQEALTNMNNGIVTVFNSNGSPQIFGTRNGYNQSHSGSYFARCNVSRVLASVLKNVLAQCVDVIHTDTAANAVSRKMFETNLNNIIGQYISTQDLQADSIAICNGSNNTDAQTQGGTILNIILALHFIGLVEKINIRVIATETGVTVNFA